MILISKQISSVHPRLCRRVWPGKAGHEVLSQFLSSFRKFEKSCVQWERRTDQWTGLTDQSPVSGDMCWPLSAPLTPLVSPLTSTGPWRDMCLTGVHWPLPWAPLARADHWWPLVTGDQCSVPGVCPQVTSLVSPSPSGSPLFVMQMVPLSLSLSLSQLFVPHRPRMPLVSCEMEYSETENRLKIELIIDKMRREICTIWHQSAGTGWVWRSAQSPRPELKITAALSGLTGNWKMFSILGRDSCNPNTSKKSEIEKLHFDNIFSKWS